MVQGKVKRKKPSGASRSSAVVLTAIGLFKLFKALLLVAIGFGAIHFLHHDAQAALLHWAQVLHVDPEGRFVHKLLVKVFNVTPKQLKELSVGIFFYAGLFATEGIGLLLRKRWAEYVTIVTTSGLIPLEAYEIGRHFTVTRLVVTVVNILIVIYLVRRVRSN
jgi:uncharacterized membrane protein (DUF2068 family)